MAISRPGYSSKLYPPNCSDCGYDMRSVGHTKKPIRCPECGEVNPIIEIDGEFFNYRARRKLTFAKGVPDLLGEDEPLSGIATGAITLLAVLGGGCVLWGIAAGLGEALNGGP